MSFDVSDGEFVVLVGPSGCGKSTLLRVLAGLERATSGAVQLDDARVDHLPAKDRDLAMVFQNYALYPHMTVAENVAFGLRMRGQRTDARQSAVARVARILGLEALVARVPAELSGGQRQRVAMGRAIAREPAVFLMDEPLSNLDAELRLAVRREIKALQRRLGVTTIYVTHDQTEAMTLADRIAVLRQGTLQQIGTPEALYDRPANRFVAGFLGTPPMSFLEVTATSEALEAPGLTAARVSDRAGPWPAGPVALGLRPEHMRLGGAGARWRGQVASVENLGGEALIHVERDGAALTLRHLGHAPAREGETVDVALDLAAAHLFAPDGQALRQ